MPRRTEELSPERAEQLRSEIAALVEQRAEVCSALKLPAEIADLREQKRVLLEDLEIQHARAKVVHENRLAKLDQEFHDKWHELNITLSVHQEQLSAVIKSTELAEAERCLQESRLANQRLCLERLEDAISRARDRHDREATVLDLRKAALEKAYTDVNAALVKFEERQKELEVFQMQLQTRERDISAIEERVMNRLKFVKLSQESVEKLQNELSARNAQYSKEYSEFLVKVGKLEEEHKQKVMTFNSRMELLSKREREVNQREESCTQREKDLAVNTEAFYKEKKKHDWANREK